MSIIKVIKEKIRNSIDIIDIDIIDESIEHADHYFASSSAFTFTHQANIDI